MLWEHIPHWFWLKQHRLCLLPVPGLCWLTSPTALPVEAARQRAPCLAPGESSALAQVAFGPFRNTTECVQGGFRDSHAAPLAGTAVGMQPQAENIHRLREDLSPNPVPCSSGHMAITCLRTHTSGQRSPSKMCFNSRTQGLRAGACLSSLSHGQPVSCLLIELCLV